MVREGEFDKMIVELHWAFGHRGRAPAIDVEGVWKRMTPVNYPPVTTLMMHPNDQLILAAIHLVYHAAAGTMKLKWLVDIAMMTTQPPKIEWDGLLAEAKRLGALRILLTTLAITQDTTGVILPDQVNLLLKRDHASGQLAFKLQQLGFPDRYTIPDIENNLLYFKLRERWRDKITTILFHLRPTKADYALLNLPRGFGFLYWAIRPFRLILDHSFGFARALTATRLKK
jgi:hypothetical protein